MGNCVFCKIVNKDIASELIYEDDYLIAFNDMSPQAPVHILLVSKEHISSLADLDEEYDDLACRLLIEPSPFAIPQAKAVKAVYGTQARSVGFMVPEVMKAFEPRVATR